MGPCCLTHSRFNNMFSEELGYFCLPGLLCDGLPFLLPPYTSNTHTTYRTIHAHLHGHQHTIHFSVIEKMPWLFATLLKWIRWQNIPEVVHLQQGELKRKTSPSLTLPLCLCLLQCLYFTVSPSYTHILTESQTQWIRLTAPFVMSQLPPFFVPVLYYNMNGPVQVELDHLSCVNFFLRDTRTRKWFLSSSIQSEVPEMKADSRKNSENL